MQQWRLEIPAVAGDGAAVAFDEASMERSKGFVKALQELKNLRPQLYSAAEYCERSYLHSEQKQMVLDNIKDYALRALVNAVDHLGTVASKLSELFEQQASETSTLDVKVSCLNQKILTCQVYMDQEGLRQHRMLGAIPKLHKHYILPKLDTGSRRVQGNVTPPSDVAEEAKPRPFPTAKTLSWHLASETVSPKGVYQPPTEDLKSSKVTPDRPWNRGKGATSPFSRHQRPTIGNRSAAVDHANVKDGSDGRHRSTIGSLDFHKHGGLQIQRRPAQPKNMLAAFFVKHKASKQKSIPVV